MRAVTLWLLGSAVVAAAVVVSTLPSSRTLRPPVIRLVTVEPAGIIDDSGEEMRLITLAVKNDNAQKHSDPSRDALFVQDSPKGFEVEMSNSWIRVITATNLWGFGVRLLPGSENPRALALVPGKSRRCRVSVEYAVPSLSAKGLLESAVTRLPMGIRSRISYKFWRWIGFPGIYRPGKWRQNSVELQIPLTSMQTL